MDPNELSAIWNLANLIERGSEGKKQITGHYMTDQGVCSIGACMNALDIQINVDLTNLKPIRDYLGVRSFPYVMYPAGVDCWPDTFDITRPIGVEYAIIMLNDVAKWSFAQIVQWLRDLVLSDAGATETAQNA